MQNNFEASEMPSRITRVNLLEPSPFSLPSEIEIPVAHLATGLWPEMKRQTQHDGKERAVVVSSIRGKTQSSAIFIGTAEKGSTAASITPPLFPHGFKSLLPGVKDLAYVHTHPKPEDTLGHLKTTLLSDGDIRSFDNSVYPALVMIDPGGVHILLRTPNYSSSTLPNYNLHEEALKRAKEGNNTTAAAMTAQAHILAPVGIRYYFTSSMNNTNNGSISLKDVRSLKE